ncbi:MAG: prepilin-type N-terminal cleavage/methylation domain-containing protein [Gammaproteobacteria bacterium]|nr:prepilin-type N-terminal cleavage/methylation domain-containing protein [Gammaproteobacteria bacterium]
MRRKLGESRRRASGGFTLVELTIAIAVFAVGMLSLSGMLLAAMQGGSRGRHTTQASAIAESQMEQLQRVAWTQIAPSGGWSTPVVVHNTVQAATDQNEQSYSVEWRTTDLVTGWTRAVDVRVTWDEPGRPNRSVTFSSIRFNREGA